MNSNQFKTGIQDIKQYASENDISEAQVREILEECFQILESKTYSRVTNILKFLKTCGVISVMIILLTFTLYNHPKTHTILVRNIQNFIYPGLRIFRKVAVPVITAYPSLTEWYDEWCLVENPYFRVNEMDCWPCGSVNSVQDLTGFNVTPAFNTGIPFLRNEEIFEVDLQKLQKVYTQHQDIFNAHGSQISSNQASYRAINDVMQKDFFKYPFSDSNLHITWRVNRMEPGRVLRKLFPKLTGVPDWWSPSTEKFILIDEPKAPAYSLPNPECANVIVQCKNGERLIQLTPSPECIQNCKKMSITLTSHQSLWYNWWYWRPSSHPSNNTTVTTIMYLSSFC